MSKVELHVLVDVNVYIDALQDKRPVHSVGELYSYIPLLAEIVSASADAAHLTDSDHVLDLLESKAVSVMGYTEDQASHLVALVTEISRVSQGIWVGREDGEDVSRLVAPWLGRRFHGNGRGQIDHEDLQVLAASVAPLLDGAPANEMSLVVTRDGGFHNVADDMSRHRVHVAHAYSATSVVRAAAAHQ